MSEMVTQQAESSAQEVQGWYPGRSFEKNRRALIQALEEGGRVVTLTGAPGVGKSYLLHHLEQWIPPHSSYLLLENPGQPTDTFVHEISASLAAQQRDRNINSPLWQDNRDLVAAIRVHLQSGHGLVMAIDQAHLLKGENLRLIQSVLAIDPQKGRSVQLVLSGRRQLQEQLDTPEYHFLDSQVDKQLRLGLFGSRDVEGYVGYLLEQLEMAAFYQFSPSAYKVLERYGGDNPRKLNRLMNQIMIKARQWHVTRIGGGTIHEALASEEENWRFKAISRWLKGSLRWILLPVAGFVAGQLFPINLFNPASWGDPSAVIQPSAAMPIPSPQKVAPMHPLSEPVSPLLEPEGLVPMEPLPTPINPEQVRQRAIQAAVEAPLAIIKAVPAPRMILPTASVPQRVAEHVPSETVDAEPPTRVTVDTEVEKPPAAVGSALKTRSKPPAPEQVVDAQPVTKPVVVEPSSANATTTPLKTTPQRANQPVAAGVKPAKLVPVKVVVSQPRSTPQELTKRTAEAPSQTASVTPEGLQPPDAALAQITVVSHSLLEMQPPPRHQAPDTGGALEKTNLATAIGRPESAAVVEFGQESPQAVQDPMPVTDGGFLLVSSGVHSLEKPYVLQFGTVNKIIFAESLADKVRQAGVEPFIHSSQRKGKKLYSVRLAFASKQEAKSKMRALERSHGLTPMLLVIK
ncbi:AAA family ATPase [Magnetococcus sp. PR-3]|uniref:AAA family ATPase n=1 Tax=Magnetococcus sp. PR-3 TaxID=3120355 RepID=UPI002FCE622A